MILQRNEVDHRIPELIPQCLAQNAYYGLPTSTVKSFSSLLNLQEHEK